MFLAKKAESQLILILGVESTVVCGSLAVISAGALPEVIFTHNVGIAYGFRMDNNHLVRATRKAISEIIQVTQQHIHIRRNLENLPVIPHKISAVHYVLSSPWIVSETKLMTMNFEKDVQVSKKYVCELIEADRAKIVPVSAEPMQVVEQKIFDVKLNGYSVADWENKQTSSLNVSFTVSIASARMVECFIEECRHLVHHNKVQFHSSLLLQYIGVEKVLKSREDYYLVHVHGDYTDTFVVRRKTCVFFGSLHYGVRTIIGRIGTIINNNKQAVDSIMSLYTSGKLDDVHNKKDIEVVEEVVGEWYKKLSKLLSESGNEMSPSTSVIINTLTHNDCFLKILRKINPKAFISELPIDDLLTKVVFEEQSEKSRLSSLYTIAIHSLLV
ncbi:MAG: hypothetical protein WCS89_01560 [Candidatus Paceibacterota bacterium]|jgi:hypothetical protein